MDKATARSSDSKIAQALRAVSPLSGLQKLADRGGEEQTPDDQSKERKKTSTRIIRRPWQHALSQPKEKRLPRRVEPSRPPRDEWQIPQAPLGSEGRILTRAERLKKTVRIKRPVIKPASESLLSRSPLLVEVVSAIAVGPSPHVRPDLIGKTIAGGKRIKGATSTADIGLRSGPAGFAVKAHEAIPPGRYKKRKKRKRRRK